MLESRSVLVVQLYWRGWGGLVFCSLRVVDGMRLGGDAGHVDCM